MRAVLSPQHPHLSYRHVITEAVENTHKPSSLCCCHWTKRFKALRVHELFYLELRSHRITNGIIQHPDLTSGLCICD